jgi:hypothetical protein
MNPMKMKNSVISFVAVSALAISSASAAVNFSDSFSTDTRSNYTVTASPSDVTYSGTAGTSGGGGLALASTSDVLPSIISNSSFTVATGEALDMSVMFQKGTPGYTGSSQLFLGISDQSNYSWGGAPGTGFSALGISVNAFNQIFTRSATNGSGVTNANFTPSGPFNLTNGNWYKLSATITKPATGNDWTISGQFQDWGSTGTTPGATILTLPTATVTIASATFNDAATANYGQFGYRASAWSGADNFTMVSPVPEPSTMALCGLGALALVSRRRR